MLVADRGIAGLVIRPRGVGINLVGRDLVRADAAVTINGLVRWTITRGCGGLEAWAGTPGTVGGAIYGNAHWRAANIGDLVESVRLASPDGTLRQVPADRLEFAYDTSRLQRTGEVVLWAAFRVRPGCAPEALRAVARESLAFRKRTQPLASPSAGCIFQNPQPGRDVVPDGIPPSAGALVDRAGLKDQRVGGARVSPTHGNFIVNDGSATAADIAALADRCRDRPRALRRHAARGVAARRLVGATVDRLVGSASDSRPRAGQRDCALGEAGPGILSLASRNHRLVGPSGGRYMSTLIIEGGSRLSGIVDVEGNKNAALPLMAATLLTREPCTLTNVPRIADVEVMARLLLDLGAEVEGIGSTTLRIQCREVRSHEPDRALVGRLRGSVLLLGPLLARTGRASVAPPGGDFPTRRTIRTHLEALRAMGAVRLEGPGHQLEAPHGLQPASIYLDEASVTGTETAILAAAAAPGDVARSATPPPSRTSSSCASSCAPWASASRARGRTRSASRAAAGSAARPRRSTATTSRPAAGRSSPRSPAARSRFAARATSTWRS